ncbi:rhodanese-like domain-containing protein [Geobacter anodireducens]|uniref:Rhodanese-like domain-containing protein n=1 Tax=Geobacter anodireducens TaxID=1340425 RepID=A0ABR9NQD7_9BACT|nr:rhodanese-like domain-containing protein [Geobacter anodireducens]ANA39325.1 rhodanese-like domain-containing protein [Geobacter anodireducens]MBE2886470.1 rhodanese-like domain-containing protein [Geobacter anodireducens]
MIRKFIIAVLMVASLAATALAASYRNIGSAEAKALLDTKRNVFLLDVRTPDEYRQARLSGSVLIPINEVERRIAQIPKGRPVLIYCAVGSRSGLVAGYLTQRGYGEVYNMHDGIVGWYRNGFPITR